MPDWISKCTDKILFFLLKIQIETSFSIILFKCVKIPWQSKFSGIIIIRYT